ncbi:porphobilinogen synthase [Methanobrevibacter smithii]|jgi:porphobilinogen synthase|uniref:Delta-aminolevulinic acid dehydratase n=1 Tax=Methanobrevibacter smithii CAG:186 TaxID=1263088 RepID=R7PWH2_METSM|nr:porphobilinogen synthase [Methanobrevibacter smithii]MDO5829967.1 porphobilinogen synthase [Methanobrevibacter smithii]MEE0720319.1 porphobilinogen synthase [Methanobrevibacter smithii]CDF29061.1 delta-aminolevulinic acid dehydratase [Methanobrevibacter smithii CAG:186]HJI99106.1 porphobilinogen synthase [Methanobrevibacter smithii]
MVFPVTRMRRYRKNSKIRDIVRETKLNKEDLIYPIFFKEELQGDEKEPIESMPGEYRYSLNAGIEFAKQLEEKGLKSIIVFGVPLPESKDEVASPDYSSTGIVQRAIRELKKQTDLVVIGDVCLCQYTSHGHCGLIKENDDTDDGVEILNDESLEYLAKVAVSYAKAGVDIVAPSDMMDGRVDAIRTALDENGFYNVMIMSYSAKYASAFYEPFRAAADSSPTHGNRKSYQMDPANALEAIRECELDVIEGADFLMVKPALPYLDIIKTIREEFTLPLVSYNVSGEYSMIMAAIEKGFLTENAILESLISIKRAGSDLIITNFASYVLLNDLL